MVGLATDWVVLRRVEARLRTLLRLKLHGIGLRHGCAPRELLLHLRMARAIQVVM